MTIGITGSRRCAALGEDEARATRREVIYGETGNGKRRNINMLLIDDRLGHLWRKTTSMGAVARLVGIEGGVVSERTNLESPGVGAPGGRPRHDQRYHDA
jgi:hypothetical protein